LWCSMSLRTRRRSWSSSSEHAQRARSESHEPHTHHRTTGRSPNRDLSQNRN
jgi:hypothetical protein